MGVSVSAIKPEIKTAPASASANSTNNRPVRPGVKARGAYTAAKVSDMATMANPISRAPLIDAENGSIPSSMCRKMFSNMTMASSTTRPMASTRASKVSVLIEKPARAIMAKQPIRLTGIVTMGMIDARNVRKNTNITSATKTTASTMVWNTLLIDFSMNTELSLAISMETPGGKFFCRRGISARTPLLNSSGLAVAWRNTPTVIADRPFRRVALRSSAGPS